MKTIEQLAREAGIPFNKYGLIGCDSCETDIDDDLQRFHDAAIAQYREGLLAGVGDAVAHVNGNDLDNMLTDRTAIIETAKSSWRTKPLYTADQMAQAIQAERNRCLNCYSPDDTVSDYQDKIRSGK